MNIHNGVLFNLAIGRKIDGSRYHDKQQVKLKRLSYSFSYMQNLNSKNEGCLDSLLPT